MNETYDTIMKDLRHEVIGGDARPATIDEIITKLFQLPSAINPADFLSLLRDDAEYDEGMFSLIHAAESANDTIYVQGLIQVFAAIASTAPQWASVVLMRILNSPATQIELIRQLAGAPSSARNAIGQVCGRIAQDNPEFLAKTVPVTLAAGN